MAEHRDQISINVTIRGPVAILTTVAAIVTLIKGLESVLANWPDWLSAIIHLLH
jgi:hypothetical protein